MTVTVTDPAKNGSKMYKGIGTRTLKGCIHKGRVKNDHHHPPKKIQECQRSLYPKFKSVEM